MNAKNAFALTVCLIAFGLLVRALNVHSYPTPVSSPDDFRAFYCAGRAIDAGSDPYLMEPLRSCERQAAADFGMVSYTTVPLPAPLPPYAFLPFAALGLIPFVVASNCWFVVSCAALLGAIAATRRLTRAAPLAIAAAMFVAGGLVSFPDGQIAPLATACFALAALAIRSGRYGASAAALAVTTIAPPVALPVFIATFAEKNMRRPLLVTILTIAIVDVFMGGPALTGQYVTAVLPLQAAAHVDQLEAQFSLSTVLWGLGASRSAAEFCGALDYAAMLGLGVFAAIRLRRRFDDRAMLVLVPPAFVVLGGTYVHLFLMLVALPLAFALLVRVARGRRLVAAAIVALALPLQAIVVASPLHHAFYPRAALAPHVARSHVIAFDPATIPQAAELVSVADRHAPAFWTFARYCALKVPTWLALIVLVSVCLREATRASERGPGSPTRAQPA